MAEEEMNTRMIKAGKMYNSKFRHSGARPFIAICHVIENPVMFYI